MNDDNDVMIDLKFLKICGEIAVNNYDINGNKINSNNLKDPKYSSCFGSFNDLCPIYINVGLTEILLGDSLYIANKIHKCNGNIKLNIEPYLSHVYPISANILDESKYAIVRALSWLLPKCKKAKYSKL